MITMRRYRQNIKTKHSEICIKGFSKGKWSVSQGERCMRKFISKLGSNYEN
jgi:hypothetical protein